MNNIKKSDTSYPLRDTSSGHENHNSSLRQNRSVVQHGLSSYSCTHQTFCNVCSMSHSTASIVSRKTLFVKLEFKMPTRFCVLVGIRYSYFSISPFQSRIPPNSTMFVYPSLTSYRNSNISCALVSGLTFGITFSIIPFSSMMKVVRTTPKLTLP